MSILQFETQVSPEGVITLPPIPEYHDRKVVVRIDETDSLRSDPSRVLPNGKTAVEDFLQFCKDLNFPPLSDEEVDQIKYDYLMEKYG